MSDGSRLAPPTPIEKRTRTDARVSGVSPSRSHPDLTSREAWALDHITHCPTCGAWEMVTDAELRSRAEPGWVAPSWCAHVPAGRVPA